MAVEEGGAGPTPYRSMKDTPTWALATVCFVFIFTGISIEYLIHLLSHWLKKSRKTALYEAMDKLKSDLAPNAKRIVDNKKILLAPAADA